MPTAVQFKGVDALTKKLAGLPNRIKSGVKVSGPAVDYALIWELGAAYLDHPGPKTMWSTTADGEKAILTIQAPHGYIRVNRRKYIEVLQEEYKAISWQDYPISEWPDIIRQMMVKVANQCALLISATAPIDSGQLSESIGAVEPGDPLLEGDKELSLFKDLK